MVPFGGVPIKTISYSAARRVVFVQSPPEWRSYLHEWRVSLQKRVNFSADRGKRHTWHRCPVDHQLCGQAFTGGDRPRWGEDVGAGGCPGRRARVDLSRTSDFASGSTSLDLEVFFHGAWARGLWFGFLSFFTPNQPGRNMSLQSRPLDQNGMVFARSSTRSRMRSAGLWFLALPAWLFLTSGPSLKSDIERRGAVPSEWDQWDQWDSVKGVSTGFFLIM